LGTSFGVYGKLPDLRGEFIRGIDLSRGIDSGRVFGSIQLDQFQDHKDIKITDPNSGDELTGV
jgi:hypothetical protein